MGSRAKNWQAGGKEANAAKGEEANAAHGLRTEQPRLNIPGLFTVNWEKVWLISISNPGESCGKTKD